MQPFSWALIAAVVWGIAPILEKIGLRQTEPIVGLFYRCIGVMIGMFILGTVMLKPSQILSVHWKSALWLIAGGFLASFIGQIAFYHGLKTGQISRVVPVSASYPLLAFVLGILILGESINLARLAGVILVIIGIWIIKLN